MKVIQFTKLRFYMISFSFLFVIAGVVGYYLNGGFNLGIDFSSGLTQQFQVKPGVEANIDKVREALAALGKVALQVVGNADRQEFILKVQTAKTDTDFQVNMETRIRSFLSAAFGADNVVVKSSDFMEPRYSKTLATETVWVILAALALILIYMAFRFALPYAVSAILCEVHDTVFMLSVIAIFRLEVNTNTVAAILTIIGYSINDTIVNFDRVRENNSLLRESDLETIMNVSITQSLSRTILTAFTTLLAVLMLYLFSTAAIKDFSLNLMVGIVVGTYSTVFIAAPIALGWERAKEKHRKKKELKRYGQLPAAVQAGGGRVQVRETAALAAPGPVEEAPLPADLHAPAPALAGAAEEAPAGGGQAAAKLIRIQPSRKKKKKKRH